MNYVSWKTLCAIVVLTPILWLLTIGCRSQVAPPPQQVHNELHSEAVAKRLHAIVAGEELPDLRWPHFTDYRLHVQRLYEAVNYAPVWVRDGQPSPQALEMITALQDSQQKGLNPEDYNASLWPLSLNALKAEHGSADMVARFDAALTVSAMRYISDLHIGRVNPKHFKFGIDIEQRKYDLPQFLLQKVLTANNVQAVLSDVEPSFNGYRRTEAALQKYLALAAQDDGMPLPEVQKTLALGDTCAGVTRLVQRLRLLGDLPQGAIVRTDSGVYSEAVVDAVKHFQMRHGLQADGRLGKETLRQLNTPLSDRVVQLEDALERWRWLPPDFPQPPIAVNIPEFVLRVFSADRHVALRMNVVVGEAVRDQTPVFAKEMKYIVFRPYWNVPLSITRAEIVPALQRDKNYLARKNFEVTDRNGRIVTSSTVSDDVLVRLRSGVLMVRQKPGLANSLGLVKFMFPNEHNVYLHSTPAPELFTHSRRDFSHGCVRVEKPVELAEWLLHDKPQWTPDNIKAAMQSGPDNQQVNLTKPVPVLMLYVTAVVEEDGAIYFFDDIYGHDRALNEVLAKRQPYPA